MSHHTSIAEHTRLWMLCLRLGSSLVCAMNVASATAQWSCAHGVLESCPVKMHILSNNINWTKHAYSTNAVLLLHCWSILFCALCDI